MRRAMKWTGAMAVLCVVTPLVVGCGGTPEEPAEEAAPAPTNPFREFGITANNAFFYYDDVERAAEFYTDTLGIDLVADYDFAKILRPAATSYLILVDAEMGMHSTDEAEIGRAGAPDRRAGGLARVSPGAGRGVSVLAQRGP